MAITLKDKTLKIDLKLQLKYEIGGKEYIHYPDLTEDLEPELFEKITEAVAESMNKQLAGRGFNHETKAKLNIPHVSGSALSLCEKCAGFTFTMDGKQCTNCGHYR